LVRGSVGICVTRDIEVDRLPTLGMLGSALAGRPVGVATVKPGERSWTDGQTIFIDTAAPNRDMLKSLAVQASLIAAGSLDPDILRRLSRSRLADRYLAVEGHRALLVNAEVLPRRLAAVIDHNMAHRSDSAATSLTIASDREALASCPPSFGVIRAKKALAATRRAGKNVDHDTPAHIPHRATGDHHLKDLDDGELTGGDEPDLFTSPVGGGGFIGKWLSKLLSSARQADGSGGGPPGADAPTHRGKVASRAAHAVASTAPVSAEDIDEIGSGGRKYPEWDANRKAYRVDWCTVHETKPVVSAGAPHAVEEALALWRPLARLGMGFQRRHRQPQGDDIDVDAAVQARVEIVAGSAPDEAIYHDSVRRRRDLSVLLLLDISGSTAEPGTIGKSVHQQQRSAAANLAVALHDLGDRVALYAYYSQGRAAVHTVPLKRFDDRLDTKVVQRLNSLKPGGYSRLGAAIRHGAAVVEAHGGTSRRLLVVLSDGLAYDHGYERAYGAADARRALTEARRRGIGCVCLTVGAGTDVSSLRNVFGSAAHAVVARPEQLRDVIGPLFRSALRSAETRRRVS
jgi:nitric oxide reductase NorD protein